TEIVIYFHPIEPDENAIKNIKLYLELGKYSNCNFFIYYDNKGNDTLDLMSKENFKISYQNEFFSKIFGFNQQHTLNGKKSAIELLQLDKRTYAAVSLV